MRRVVLVLLLVLFTTLAGDAQRWAVFQATNSSVSTPGGLMEVNIYGVPNSVLPANYYDPGIAAESVSTSDYYGVDGLLVMRPYDLLTMGPEGAAIAAKYGRYVWPFGPDHPGGQASDWTDGQSFRIGFSSDPGILPTNGNQQIAGACGDLNNATLNPNTTNPYCLYMGSSIVYSPEDVGNVFHMYVEGTDNVASGVGFTFTGTTTNGSPVITGLTTSTALFGVSGEGMFTGTGIPANTNVAIVGRFDAGAIISSGSATVTGITSTASMTGGGCGVGDAVYSDSLNYAIPPSTCIQTVVNGTTVTLTRTAAANATGMYWDNGHTLTINNNATASGTVSNLHFQPGHVSHVHGMIRSNDFFAWTINPGPIMSLYRGDSSSIGFHPERVSAGNWLAYETVAYLGGPRIYAGSGDQGVDANGWRSLIGGLWSSTDGFTFIRNPSQPASNVPSLNLHIGTILPEISGAMSTVTIAGQKWITGVEDDRYVIITLANPAVVFKSNHGYSAGDTLTFLTGGFTVTGDMVSGSAVITNTSTTGMQVGMAINPQNGIPLLQSPPYPIPLTGVSAGTTILSINSGTQFTMSSPATLTQAGNHILIANLPQPITALVTYYVKTVVDADHFTISATNGGTALDTTGSQTCQVGTLAQIMASQSAASQCIWVPAGGQYVARFAVDANWNVLSSPAPVRISAKYPGLFPGPGYLQALASYLEDGVMHYYVARGFFQSAANFSFTQGATFNSGNGALQQELTDRYCEIVDATAAAAAAPVGVRISAAAGAVTLSWDNCLPNQTYRIYRGGPSAQTTFVADVNGLTYTDSGVPLGIVQYYKVVTMQSGVERQARVVSSYVSSSSSFVNKHVTRALADGGDLGTCDTVKMDAAYNWLVANGLYNSLTYWIDPGFCVKQNASNVISKIYDMGTTRNPKYNDVWFCSSSPCTGASGTTYDPTVMNGNTQGWVNGASNDFGVFGGLLDSNNMNGRYNAIRMKTEISVFASYIKGSSGTNIALYGQGEPSDGYDMTLQHLSGTPGTASFYMNDAGGGTSHPATATAAFSGSATAPHTIGGTFGHTGNLIAYADGIAGTAAPGLNTNTDLSLASTLKGQLYDNSGNFGVFGVMGSPTSHFSYGAPSTYGTLASQASYTGGDFIMFSQELTPTQMASLHTLVSGWVTPVVAKAYNIVTDFSATCNGSTDDSTHFTAFNTAAVAWDAANPGVAGDIVLTIPNSKCMFIAGAGAFNAGILNHRVRIVGAGPASEFSDGGTGNGWFLGAAKGQFNDNAHSIRIASAVKGATSITLNSLTNCASLWVVGQWDMVAGLDMQGDGGYPGNPAFWDFVKISAVNCGTGVVTFATTPLTHDYKSTWPLYSAGNSGNLDQGGPATIYQLDPTWPITVEVNNLILTAGPGFNSSVTNGKDVTFKNVTMNVGVNSASCQGPSVNMIFRVIKSNYTGCGIEVDKIIDAMLWLSVNPIPVIDLQSASVKQMLVSGSNVTSYINGSGINTFIANSTMPQWGPGAHAFGASYGQTWVLGNNIASITPFGSGSSGTGVTGVGTWSGATYTILDSDIPTIEGGNPTLTWAVPGANIYFNGSHGHQGPVLQVADLSRSGSSTVVTFNQNGVPLSGGLPTMPLSGGTTANVSTHSAPQLIASGNYGSAAAIDINQTPAGAPLGSYSKMIVQGTNGSYSTPTAPPIVTGNPSTPHTIDSWGQMVGVNITVGTAYTGSTGTMHFDLNGPVFQTLGSNTGPVWNTFEVNAKVASATPRHLDPISANNSGSQSGDTLTSPSGGANTWLLTGQQQPVYSSIPGDFGATSTTIEIITNQGVVNP